MEKEFKIGNLIKTNCSTCMIIKIIPYQEYLNLQTETSFWSCPDNDNMICIEVLHDKRKKQPIARFGHSLDKTFWIPYEELTFRSDIEAGGDRWEVFGGSLNRGTAK